MTRPIEWCKQRGFLEYDPGDVHGHIAVADDGHVSHMLETQLLVVVEVVIERAVVPVGHVPRGEDFK
jgi:hypothetical protein